MNPTRRQLLAALTGLCATSGASVQLVDAEPKPLMGIITFSENVADPTPEDLMRFEAKLKMRLEKLGLQLPILILPPGVTWQTVTQENAPC